MDNKHTRISLWSGPRNVSTALMYSFAQRSDTKVYDEPLYGYYLQNSDANTYHPSAEQIMQTMETDGEKVVKMMLTNTDKEVLFYKNMTHHLLDLDRSFMEEMVNVILTRDPKEMLPSFAEVIPNPTMKDVGYSLHLELVRALQSKNLPVVVLDAKMILQNPKKELARLCEIAQIPFSDTMLKWQAGKRPEDGIWAKHWYASVHKSTGFQPYQTKTKPFPEQLKPLLKDAQVCYEELMNLTV